MNVDEEETCPVGTCVKLNSYEAVYIHVRTSTHIAHFQYMYNTR